MTRGRVHGALRQQTSGSGAFSVALDVVEAEACPLSGPRMILNVSFMHDVHLRELMES